MAVRRGRGRPIASSPSDLLSSSRSAASVSSMVTAGCRWSPPSVSCHARSAGSRPAIRAAARSHQECATHRAASRRRAPSSSRTSGSSWRHSRLASWSSQSGGACPCSIGRSVAVSESITSSIGQVLARHSWQGSEPTRRVVNRLVRDRLCARSSGFGVSSPHVECFHRAPLGCGRRLSRRAAAQEPSAGRSPLRSIVWE